ncbi:hypothetical protein [Paenibacillus sp. XY044]|uniref:hypothetical protein n=1 Tax=Paenibacillus sp. XY044 TaxID=2026089 RepID=UPI000B98A3DA|nr:hypothetical protein [Paenibacillus sp. XY044]OZB94849.1 hypothetical protein CJP46_14075 [Paenibacillus sp. XY044]
MQIPAELQQALQDASHALSQTSSCWLIGGSCGLLLQDVQLDKPPRDIDIYADSASVSELHHALAGWAVDQPVLSVTDQYRSVLSHYKMNRYTLELVGGFEVQAEGSQYKVEINRRLAPAGVQAQLNSNRFSLMPLSHELLFNVLRNREDRYTAIAVTMRANLQEHLPLLEVLLKDNAFQAGHVRMISQLLHAESSARFAVNGRDPGSAGRECR